MSIFGRRLSETFRISGPSKPPSTARVASHPSPPPSLPEASSSADDALDVLGMVLHTLGRVSFSIDDDGQTAVKHVFDRWAQHVLVGSPVNGDAERASATGRRDWGGLKRFVTSHRQREVAYVVKSLEDLRSALCLFTTAFSRVVGDDGKGDVVVRAQLLRLEEAARAKDTAAVTREALATVQVVGESIERRAERHRAELVELSTHVRKLSDQLDAAKKAGETDGLTRVPNRACFDEFLRHTVDLAAFAAGDAYLMMVDVDRFKHTNDTLGHGAGDAALKSVADRLIRTFPRRGDLVARYGGDEFAVIVRDVRPDEARMLAERLVVGMRGTKVEHGGKSIPITVSVGVARQHESESGEQWVTRADAALYRAKEEGRDRWVLSGDSA